MTAKKIITTTQEIEVDVTGITLLSVEEAEKVDKNIRCIAGSWWWLRSPGNAAFNAALVQGDGSVRGLGLNVTRCYAVRPALQVSNLESSNLRIGDRFVLADEQWIVISKDRALCEHIIGKTPFHEDWKAPDANDYEKSDVKIWLENWALEKGVIQEVNRDNAKRSDRNT